MSKSARLEHRRAAAAAAARQREHERRRRIALAGGALGVVVLTLIVLVVVKVAGGGSAAAAQEGADPGEAQILQAVTSVPDAVLDQVAAGKIDLLPRRLSGEPALVADGKPLVIYVGAEYCPFCAAQRWGIVVALSRFGSFTGLRTTHSSSSDAYPNTATLSFHGSSYTSDYLSFQGVELQSNTRQGNTYAVLDQPTALQTQLLQKYNAPPYVPAESAGAIPFIDFGNKYLTSGASISPQVLVGMSGSEIATALSDSNSEVAQAILGSANAFTAAICGLTGGQPGEVCASPGVGAYTGKLNAT